MSGFGPARCCVQLANRQDSIQADRQLRIVVVEEGAMATTAVGRTAGRLRRIQDALSPTEWGKVGAMAGVVDRPQRARVGDAARRHRSPLPPRQD